MLSITFATGCEIDDGMLDADGAGVEGDASEDSFGQMTASYFYVRVTPDAYLSVSDGDEDPGADIDTIILDKGGENHFPSEVMLDADMSQYPGYKSRMISRAGMTLDAFSESDPSQIGSGSTCSTSSAGFVSIGGDPNDGAVFSFNSPIERGDTLWVLEVGGCDREGSGSTPGSEGYAVAVAVSTLVDANWLSIGTRASDGPVTAITVPELPEVALGN